MTALPHPNDYADKQTSSAQPLQLVPGLEPEQASGDSAERTATDGPPPAGDASPSPFGPTDEPSPAEPAAGPTSEHGAQASDSSQGSQQNDRAAQPDTEASRHEDAALTPTLKRGYRLINQLDRDRQRQQSTGTRQDLLSAGTRQMLIEWMLAEILDDKMSHPYNLQDLLQSLHDRELDLYDRWVDRCCSRGSLYYSALQPLGDIQRENMLLILRPTLARQWDVRRNDEFLQLDLVMRTMQELALRLTRSEDEKRHLDMQMASAGLPLTMCRGIARSQVDRTHEEALDHQIDAWLKRYHKRRDELLRMVSRRAATEQCGAAGEPSTPVDAAMTADLSDVPLRLGLRRWQRRPSPRKLVPAVCLIVTVDQLAARGAFGDGPDKHRVPLIWNDADGSLLADAQITRQPGEQAIPRLTLDYLIDRPHGQQWKQVLLRTTAHCSSGTRLICPHCDRSTPELLVPPGALIFTCRTCAGLGNSSR